jgi:16S rRNA (guanine527-N7)-methyltransferase
MRVSLREFRERLARRARKADLAITPAAAEGLERYFQLLSKWNEKINLTAFRLQGGGSDESIDRLLIEPLLAAARLPPGATLAADIGSGGGSPAIPLKLAVPTLQMRLVESKTRKAVFLREAIRVLDMRGIEVEAVRYEELLARPELHEALDVVTMRAVRVEPRTLMSLQAFLRPGGQMFLFRGPGGPDIARVLTPPLVLTATYPLVDSLRSRLVVLTKTTVGQDRPRQAAAPPLQGPPHPA